MVQYNKSEKGLAAVPT